MRVDSPFWLHGAETSGRLGQLEAWGDGEKMQRIENILSTSNGCPMETYK